jgi:hypothetical protein
VAGQEQNQEAAREQLTNYLSCVDVPGSSLTSRESCLSSSAALTTVRLDIELQDLISARKQLVDDLLEKGPKQKQGGHTDKVGHLITQCEMS